MSATEPGSPRHWDRDTCSLHSTGPEARRARQDAWRECRAPDAAATRSSRRRAASAPARGSARRSRRAGCRVTAAWDSAAERLEDCRGCGGTRRHATDGRLALREEILHVEQLAHHPESLELEPHLLIHG